MKTEWRIKKVVYKDTYDYETERYYPQSRPVIFGIPFLPWRDEIDGWMNLVYSYETLEEAKKYVANESYNKTIISEEVIN